MSDWAEFKIQVPGIDILEQVRGLLETLVIFLEVAKTILETVKIFLIDFGNPIKAIVEAIIKLILDFIESLKRTGLFLYADVPDFKSDYCLRRLAGGSKGFIQRWKGSLMDAKDSNRPRPIPGATTGGFVMLVVDAQGPDKLIALIKLLLRFFNQEYLTPRYPPPANVRAVPVGSTNEPILNLVGVFKDPPTAIAVEWTLGSSTNQTDNGFENLAQAINDEIVPAKWLIERSSKPLNGELSWDAINSDGVGYVTLEAKTRVEDHGRSGDYKKRKIRLKDENGDPFIKFEHYGVIYGDSNTASFLLGQLGTFRWIDTEIEKDKTYFYRVRAYSGTLQVEPNKTIKLELGNRNEKENPADGTNQYVKWPGPSGEDTPVMGRASGIVKCRVVDLPTDFDVLENIRRVMLAAIACNFHLEAPSTAKFDDNGQPISGTPPTWVGQGALFGKTSLATFDSVPLVSYLASTPSAFSTPDPVTGEVPTMPWQQTNVRYQAGRMVSRMGSALLEAGSSFINEFKNLMEGPLPRGASSVSNLSGYGNISELVFGVTSIEFSQESGTITELTDIDIRNGTVTSETMNAYVTAFSDAISRSNIEVAVKFLTSLTFQGEPPNWESVSLIRDLIPWSGQMLYELMEKIQAILDAFKGILDEIKLFIDLLIRKINVLEDFIKFLISILDFIDSLSVGFYFLSATGLTGGITDWFAAVDNAGGTGPSTGPGGYTGGLCIAYNAVDVAAFEAAFSLIFG